MKAPTRIFASILLVIFGVELVVMLALSVLPQMPPFTTDLIDALALTFIGAPLLWFIVAKPLAVAAEAGRELLESHASTAAAAVLRETTERTRRERALKASEGRYRSLFSHMRSGYAHCRMIYNDRGRPVDFKYLSVNEAFGRLTGLTDVVGKRVSDVIPGIAEQSPELLATYGRACATGIPETFEFDFKAQNSWLNITVYSPESDEFVAVFDDITARKVAEAQLVLRSTALNAAANPMVITDREGYVVWVNAAFTEGTGYTVEEAVGSHTRTLLKSGVHDQAFYKDLWDTILAGKVWRGEMTNRRKNGTFYPERQTITPVRDTHGEIAHFISVKRDLTRDNEREAQYRQAQKMESVGQLAGGVAHDFNNLLTVILGFTEILRMDLPEADPRLAHVGEIAGAAGRAAELTRQLLAFSRRQVLQPRVIEVNQIVTGLESMLQRVIGEDVQLVTTPDGEHGRALVDPGQLEQVIVNLAVNARDAMPTGGRLTIETASVELDSGYMAFHPPVTPGPYVMVAVTDTGTGMTEDVKTHLFEPFFTTKELGKGTGLGLATVYGIVKQSNGYIWVYSEPGSGTTFKVYLPRVQDELSAAVPAADASGPIRGNETILLVEDNDRVLRLARTALERHGYRVIDCARADEALALAAQVGSGFDLVITDVVMPGISGRELADQIHEANPSVKVLFTSGYPDDAVLRHGVLQADVNFLQKPFTADGLLRKVRSVLDRPRR